MFLVIGLKRDHWWEDAQGPNLRTAAWKSGSRYSKDVESALNILRQTDPEKVHYLRSRGNPVEFIVTGTGYLGHTTPQGVIQIGQRFRRRPIETAVVLAHEITHAERHDPDEQPPEHSLLYRLVWHTEEQEAHWQDFLVALDLWPKYHAVWKVLDAGWIFEILFRLWILPLLLSTITPHLRLNRFPSAIISVSRCRVPPTVLYARWVGSSAVALCPSVGDYR